jgi:hypothetical protein
VDEIKALQIFVLNYYAIIDIKKSESAMNEKAQVVFGIVSLGSHGVHMRANSCLRDCYMCI